MAVFCELHIRWCIVTLAIVELLRSVVMYAPDIVLLYLRGTRYIIMYCSLTLTCSLTLSKLKRNDIDPLQPNFVVKDNVLILEIAYEPQSN